MRVYCFCSAESNISIFNKSINFLKSQKGPIEFIRIGEFKKEKKAKFFSAGSLEKVDNNMLNQLEDEQVQLIFEIEFIRNLYRIAEDDYILYYTNRANLPKGIDVYPLQGTKNICANIPQYWFEAEKSDLILAYEMLISPFLAILKDDNDNYLDFEGNHELGCIGSEASGKNNIKNKIRTGFVCDICYDKLSTGKMGYAVLSHLYSIMSDLREKFNRRKPHLSRIIINRYHNVRFPDYNLEVELRPLQKAVFIFYLNHKDGCPYNEIFEHKMELTEIYKKVTHFSDPDKTKEIIENLVDPKGNIMREIVARIKSDFSRVLSGEIAEKYIIKKINDSHLIELDRNLVELNMAI